ncbi:MAG: RDD family protein [Actinobacteria bacterium]|nr:RDD family protein [Actinomycetota bacterium]
MDFEDRISIATPEGVDIELDLAGAGSRMAAGLIDVAIQGTILLALGVLTLGRETVGVAIFTVAAFGVIFVYPLFFETLMSGRTPGKRLTGLRVIRMGGRPVGFVASAVRNVVRLADWLPAGYGIGIVAIIASPRDQRLGDLAAGTVVVRERSSRRARRSIVEARDGVLGAGLDGAGRDPSGGSPPGSGWDVGAVTPREVATVRRFMMRRGDLNPKARLELAEELVQRLQAKVAGAPEGLPPEIFLEKLLQAKERLL